jgi:hypothetical protein
VGERPQRAGFVDIDHDGIARFAPDDEAHDAVVAGVGVVHHAGVAVDPEGFVPGHARTVPEGSDNHAP